MHHAQIVKAYTNMKGLQPVERSVPWHKAKQVAAAKSVEKRDHKK